MQKRYLIEDPLGSVRAALAGLSAAPGLTELDASSGRFYSKDGRSLLILATPKGDPFAGAAAEKSMAVIHRAELRLAELEPQMRLRPIGAHRYQQDAQGIVMHDVHWSAGLTPIFIVLIFIAFFRRLRLVLVALPPLAFGACVAGGVAGFIGRPVHGIVLAFAAACLGLSIDYTIHLLAAQSQRARPRSLPAAARRIGQSLALAAASTVGGLFALSLSSVAALQQMALLAVGAVAGAFVGNLLWVPILLPRLGREVPGSLIRRGPWGAAVGLAARRPGAVTLGAVILGAGFSVLATGTTVDGDLRHLDTHTPAAVADEAAFTAAFGDLSTTALALCSGASVDATLRAAEHAGTILRAHGVTRILSPTLVAPSRRPSRGAAAPGAAPTTAPASTPPPSPSVSAPAPSRRSKRTCAPSATAPPSPPGPPSKPCPACWDDRSSRVPAPTGATA